MWIYKQIRLISFQFLISNVQIKYSLRKTKMNNREAEKATLDLLTSDQFEGYFW